MAWVENTCVEMAVYQEQGQREINVIKDTVFAHLFSN